MTPEERKDEELAEKIHSQLYRNKGQAYEIALIVDCIRQVRNEALEEAAKIADPENSLQTGCRSGAREGQAIEIAQSIRQLKREGEL